MEYRKLISFGKSSFVVSLPKPWVIKQKLKKGDLVYFDEKECDLVISPKEKECTEEEKEINISVDGKTTKQIQRELIPAYINNFKTIVLSGKEIKNKAKEIEPIIQNLIALEIMEQTSNRIVAKDFLNIRDISLTSLIRKIDVITRAMIEDVENMFNEDNYENINYRDRDVNRLSYLIFRVVYYCFDNQIHASKQFKLTAQNLSRYYLLAFHIEVIADEARRIARYIRLIKLNKNKQKKITALFNQAKENYLDSMKAFYTNEVSLAHHVAERKHDLMESYEKFYLENRHTDWIAYLVNHSKRMINTIHKLGRLVYQ